MKQSSQRDLLIAYWWLFDEFPGGDREAPPTDLAAEIQPEGSSHQDDKRSS